VTLSSSANVLRTVIVLSLFSALYLVYRTIIQVLCVFFFILHWPVFASMPKILLSILKILKLKKKFKTWKSRSEEESTIHPNLFSDYLLYYQINWYVGSKISCCIRTMAATADTWVHVRMYSYVVTGHSHYRLRSTKIHRVTHTKNKIAYIDRFRSPQHRLYQEIVLFYQDFREKQKEKRNFIIANSCVRIEI